MHELHILRLKSTIMPENKTPWGLLGTGFYGFVYIHIFRRYEGFQFMFDVYLAFEWWILSVKSFKQCIQGEVKRQPSTTNPIPQPQTQYTRYRKPSENHRLYEAHTPAHIISTLFDSISET